MPVLLFADGLERRTCQRCRNIVLHGDVFQAAPAGPGATCVQGPLVVELMGDRKVDRFRCLDLQAGVELVAVEGADQWCADPGLAFELVVDHGVVGQADTGTVSGLHQDTDVVTDGGIVALDLDFAVVASWGEWVDQA
ncbi:hypothetical protein D3C81_1663110 [compost metagenome]